MQISVGSRFGPYEIVAPLGAGGMGEVYRAKDTRLKREVAIKILSDQALLDPERQQRFQREAQAVSALNHPNILAVHDVGSENGTSYMVSELVDGESLRQVVQKGPIPIKNLLDIAVQIADGLAAAHQSGITHRDLKPENIMVSRNARVKILDFGLAKLHPEMGEENVETVSRGLTHAGIILGTVHYMSPEQARGKKIDFRSDQFSFGLILYEMLTGKKAFSRNSAPETLSAIINEEPPTISSVNPKIPVPLRWLTDRCLAKDPRQRYDSTLDLYHELRNLRDHLSEAISTDTGTVIEPARPKSRFLFAAITVGLMLALLGLAFLAGKKQKPVEKEPPTFQLLTFQRGDVDSARFLPDGNTIVYSGAFGGNPFQIYTIRPERPESQLISLPSAKILSISGSGELAIQLRANSMLAVAQLAGGTPREIGEQVTYADWAPDTKNMAVIRRIDLLRRLEYPMGKVLYETRANISNLRVSPDGDHVAFVDSLDKQGPAHLFVIDRNGEKKDLGVAGYEGLVWDPAGDAIWYADLEEGGRGEEIGPAGIFSSTLHIRTLSGQDRIISRFDGRSRLYDISGNGHLLLGRYDHWVETRGLFPGDTEERDLSVLDGNLIAGVSDDGQTLLINEFGAGGGVYGTMYLQKSDRSTIRLGEGLGGALSPDGKWVLAMTWDEDGQQITILPTGSGQPMQLKHGEITEYKFWGSFAQDAKHVILSAREKDHGWRLYLQDLAGGEPQPFTPEGVLLPRNLSGSAISPDGKSVIGIGPDQKYYLYPLKGGDTVPISGLNKTDQFLRWSTDGRSIYFSDQNPTLDKFQLPGNVYRLNLSSGQKELWKEIAPADRTGVKGISLVQLTPDGKSYFYSYPRTFSQLYLVRGLN